MLAERRGQLQLTLSTARPSVPFPRVCSHPPVPHPSVAGKEERRREEARLREERQREEQKAREDGARSPPPVGAPAGNSNGISPIPASVQQAAEREAWLNREKVTHPMMMRDVLMMIVIHNAVMMPGSIARR